MDRVLIFNYDICSGCRICETFCSLYHENSVRPENSRIRVIKWEKTATFIPMTCQNCTNPICRSVCPINAIYYDSKTGALLVKDTCMGCKACVSACPFGGITFNFDDLDDQFYKKPLVVKCDLCGGDPMCVKACSRKAIEFVEPDRVSAVKKRTGAEKMSKFHFLIAGASGGVS